MSRAITSIVFLLTAVAVLAGMHYYLWVRLVRDPALPEPWSRLLTVALGLAAVGMPAGMVLYRLRWSSGLARGLIAAVYVWMGLAFILFSLFLALDLVRWIAAGGTWLASLLRGVPEPPADPERRVFIARTLAGGAVLATGVTGGVGTRIAVGDPLINEVQVRLPRFPRALSGFTIAQISDLHVGPTIQERQVQRVVSQTNALKPDLVVITGDLVDAGVAELRQAVSHVPELEAKYGVYFVTGNHEYYVGVDPWVAELRRLGVRVLRNERVTIGDPGPGGACFDLAGVEDYSSRHLDGGGPDLARALEGRDPERSLVLLAHQPRGVSEAVRAGVELQLSGHTHGGQIFPFTLLVKLVYPYVAGLYRHREPDGTEGQIFVSRGTGYWGPPMRLGAPSEISRIVLL